MKVVVFFSIIAFLLTLLQSKGILRHGMKLGFALATSLLMVHYNYGNDYETYYEWFIEVYETHYSFIDLFAPDTFLKDPGWFILYWLFASAFGSNGFFVMVAVLSVIEGVLYYKIICKYVPEKWYWLAMFLYLFHSCLYLLTFSMMRQSLVMALMLLIYSDFREKTHLLRASLLFLFCIFVHKSSIILLPFLFLNYLPLRDGRFIAIILTIALFAFLLLSQLTQSIFERIMLIPLFDDYESLYEDEEVTISFGLGYMLKLLIFGIYMYYLVSSDTLGKYRDYVILAAISFIILPFQTIIPLIARINFYFQLFTIIAIPAVYNNIKDTILRNGLLILVCLLELYGYYSFFSPSSVFYDSYLNFQTIFFIFK